MNNEPAFPFKCQGPTTGPEIYYGITIRDYLASKALPVANHYADLRVDPKLLARFAYEIADAMLVEREKKNYTKEI